jgi:uncharacterized membrane protein
VADTNAPPPILPAHLEETIGSITRLHAEHHQNATWLQRAVDRVTALLGRPGFIGVLTIIVVGWMSLNLLAAALGDRPIDPPPFSGLGSAVSLVSLYMVVLILATQRREDQLAQHREHLILELALLGEQKTAKVIELFRAPAPAAATMRRIYPELGAGMQTNGRGCRPNRTTKAHSNARKLVAQRNARLSMVYRATRNVLPCQRCSDAERAQQTEHLIGSSDCPTSKRFAS